MEDENNIETDSINWGSASKGTAKKVYGNILIAPAEFGRKIEIMKIAERLALGELSFEQYETEILKYKVPK